MLVVAAIAMPFLAAGPVAAECNPPGADPSFRRAAPYAGRILVGTVVAIAPDDMNTYLTDGRSYAFTVAVDRTLRGPAAATLEIRRLETGGCERWLPAAPGDQIALALDARSSDPTVPRNMGAWLRGAPPSSVYETLTLDEVIRAAGMQRPPDTSTVPSGRESRLDLPAVLALFGVAIVMSWAWVAATRPATERQGAISASQESSREPGDGHTGTTRRTASVLGGTLRWWHQAVFAFARRCAIAVVFVVIVLGCTFGRGVPAQKPQVTIQNESGRTVDVFSERDGHLTLMTTLQPGDLFGSEPAGVGCDDDSSYVIQVAGRVIARLDRPGCTGASLAVTPEMLQGH